MLVRGNEMTATRTHTFHRIAPWPFVLFGAVAIVSAAIAWPALGWAHGIMSAFDLAALSFLLVMAPLFRYEARRMREVAKQNDANRSVLLLLASIVSIVILVCVASELLQKGRPKPLEIALIVGTLCLSWVFSTAVYALHYAHLFYLSAPHGGDRGGISFPGTEEPDYWDFAYFSSCLAMTFQTSDTDITSQTIRKVVISQTLGSFIFNIGVIAFSINILGSS